MQIGIYCDNKRCMVSTMEQNRIQNGFRWDESVEAIFAEGNEAESLTAAIIMDQVTPDMMVRLKELRAIYDLYPHQLQFYTKEEALFGFLSMQSEASLAKNIGLFNYENNTLKYYQCQKKKDRMIISDMDLTSMMEGADDIKPRDVLFQHAARQALSRGAVSIVYLYGDGFDGSWLNSSKQVLCSGRRVFFEQHLFSVGALWLIRGKREEKIRPLIDTSSVTFATISMRLLRRGREERYVILQGGQAWYKSSHDFAVFVKEVPALVLAVEYPGAAPDRMIPLELKNFEEGLSQGTKLKISVEYLDWNHCRVTASDLGFGNIRKSSHRIFQEMILFEHS